MAESEYSSWGNIFKFSRIRQGIFGILYFDDFLSRGYFRPANVTSQSQMTRPKAPKTNMDVSKQNKKMQKHKRTKKAKEKEDKNLTQLSQPEHWEISPLFTSGKISKGEILYITVLLTFGR